MQKILILINDAPYGTEKAYNGLRLANQLNKAHEDAEVRIFLMADAVTCAIPGQVTANGYYNIPGNQKKKHKKKRARLGKYGVELPERW